MLFEWKALLLKGFGFSPVIFGPLDEFPSVVGLTAAATLRQVQRRTSVVVVKRLYHKIKVSDP